MPRRTATSTLIACLMAAAIVVGCRSRPDMRTERPMAAPLPGLTAEARQGVAARPDVAARKQATARSALLLASHRGVIEELPAPEFPIEPVAVQSANISLAEAVGIAMQDNPRLREAAARVRMARADATIAYAPFLPVVGANYSYAAFSQPVIPGGSWVPASIDGGADNYNLAEAGIQWTLCDFGRTAGRYGQAVDQTQIAEFARQRAIQTIAYEAAAHYFRLLAADANVQTRRQAVRDAESILADTRSRKVGGVAEREDVLRSEVRFALAREQYVDALRQRGDAEGSLNVTMGWPAQTPIAVTELESQPNFALSMEECLQAAATLRREIRMAREAVAEAHRGIQAAEGELKPKVYMRGSAIGIQSDGPVNGMLEGAGIHVDQMLYAGDRYRAEVRKQQARVSLARASLQSIEQQVTLQVRVAYEAIAANRQKMALGAETVRQARENLRIERQRYDNGNATPTDIVDAQTALTAAETSYTTAIYGYLSGLAQLEYALGNDQTRLLGAIDAP